MTEKRPPLTEKDFGDACDALENCKFQVDHFVDSIYFRNGKTAPWEGDDPADIAAFWQKAASEVHAVARDFATKAADLVSEAKLRAHQNQEVK